jgi:hypothetical protein
MFKLVPNAVSSYSNINVWNVRYTTLKKQISLFFSDGMLYLSLNIWYMLLNNTNEQLRM